MRKNNLKDRPILTRMLHKYQWHLKHNGHIPEIRQNMLTKISAVKLYYFMFKELLYVDATGKICEHPLPPPGEKIPGWPTYIDHLKQEKNSPGKYEYTKEYLTPKHLDQ